MATLKETAHYRFLIHADCDIGALDSALRRLGKAGAMDKKIMKEAALAAAALANNLLQHAIPGGMILIRHRCLGRGMEVISVDRGPGIPESLHQAVAGTAIAARAGRLSDAFAPRRVGTGLPLVRSLASEFELFSQPGIGSVIYAGFGAPSSCLPTWSPLRIAGISVGLSDEGCGDGWGAAYHDPHLTALLVDGSGHGPKAAQAAEAAIAILGDAHDIPVNAYFSRANTAMRHTRGGGASLCRINPHTKQLRFCGSGNVGGRVYRSTESAPLTPRPGTLGISMKFPETHVSEHAWEPGATLILHTDGIRMRDHPYRKWTRRLRPEILAALIFRDFAAENDDAGVIVVQDMRPAPL